MKNNITASDVELAKRIKDLKGITSKDGFESILKQLVPVEKIPEIERIISGLTQEDEFALLCKMLNCCSSITPLNQTPIVSELELTPDFQATLHVGSFFSGMSSRQAPPFNCMIEVKSTEKMKFKCSRKDIDKRRKFSQRFNLPLMYAIRFTLVKENPLWIIIPADDLYNKNRVSINDDYVDSLTHLIFDNYTIMANKTYTLVRKYSLNKTGIGEISDKLGHLQSIQIISKEGKVYSPPKHDSLLLAMMYNFFAVTSSYTETYHGESVVYSGFNMRTFLTLVDVVYFLNKLLSNPDNSNYFDPLRAIANMDSKTNPTFLINRDDVEDVIRRTNESCENFFFFGLIGNHDKRVDRLLSLMAPVSA